MKEITKMVDFDWNKPATLYRLEIIPRVQPLSPEERIQVSGNVVSIYSHSKNIYQPMMTLGKMAAKLGFAHGDVLRYGNYRDAYSFVIGRDPYTGQYQAFTNPDESGTGFLTIHKNILANVTDMYQKYKDVIDNTSSTIHFHVSPHDKIIVHKLGSDVPQNWEFDLHFIDGQFQEFWIRTPQNDWQRFCYDSVTLENIQQYFTEDYQNSSEFITHCELDSKQLRKYQATFNCRCCGQDSWKSAAPKMPPIWFIRKVRCKYGNGQASWLWICRGPTADLSRAKHNVFAFLKGFPFKYTLSKSGYFVKN